jgi:hypothetical protein
VSGVVIAEIQQLLIFIDPQLFRGADGTLQAKIIKRLVEAHGDFNGADPHDPRQAGIFQHKEKALLAARQLTGKGLDAALDPRGQPRAVVG